MTLSGVISLDVEVKAYFKDYLLQCSSHANFLVVKVAVIFCSLLNFGALDKITANFGICDYKLEPFASDQATDEASHADGS